MNNTTEINAKLYNKLTAEYDKYKKALLQKTPEEILEKSRDSFIRQEILSKIEDCRIEFSYADELLSVPDLLDKLAEGVKFPLNDCMFDAVSTLSVLEFD